ncbi:hypothetical protein A3Q56_07614, partial [Intoshia linei]
MKFIKSELVKISVFAPYMCKELTQPEQKILFYHPDADKLHIKTSRIGFLEGAVKFSRSLGNIRDNLFIINCVHDITFILEIG